MGIERVATVIDPQTVQFQDGRLVRLDGLDFPDYDPNDPGELSGTAVEVLRDMLVNEDVNFYQTKNSELGRVNRMGHEIGHIERKKDNAWAQGALLALGLARVRTTERNNDMAFQLYIWEKKAREEKIGLWDMEEYKILSPEETPAHERSFQIVEGRIESAAMNQNRVYLNFGKDYRTDFTVSIPPESRRHFSKANLDPLQWNGRVIRVRGWIESYNGPFIEVDHPAAIELVLQEDTKAALPDAAEVPIVRSITTKH